MSIERSCSDESVLLDADLRGALSGDEQAWTRLYGRYRPLLERIAAGFVDAELADLSQGDMVQESWLRVWQGLPQFHGLHSGRDVPAIFCQWLCQTARHTMLNMLDARRAKLRHPPGPIRRLNDLESNDPVRDRGDRTPSSIVAATHEAAGVRDICARITEPTDRAIVHLVFWEGISLSAAAQVLGLSYDHIRRRFHALLREIEEHVESGHEHL